MRNIVYIIGGSSSDILPGSVDFPAGRGSPKPTFTRLFLLVSLIPGTVIHRPILKLNPLISAPPSPPSPSRSSSRRSSTASATPPPTPSSSPSRRTRQDASSRSLYPSSLTGFACEGRSSSQAPRWRSSGTPWCSRRRLPRRSTWGPSSSPLGSFRAWRASSCGWVERSAVKLSARSRSRSSLAAGISAGASSGLDLSGGRLTVTWRPRKDRRVVYL